MPLVFVGCGTDTTTSEPSFTFSEKNEPLGIEVGPDTVVFTDLVITGDSRDAVWTFQGAAGAGEVLTITVDVGGELVLRARDYTCAPNPYEVVVEFTHKGTPYVIRDSGECVLTINEVAAVGEMMSISVTGNVSPRINDYVTISGSISAVRQ